jgi:hypothetical protein
MALVPIRVWLIPKMPFTDQELDILDGPVASDFVSRLNTDVHGGQLIGQTLESVGGTI